MQTFKTRDVLRLTGLSGDQLREWTARRQLVKPDIPARTRGSEAQFTWQTVLLLRIAVALKTQFHLELQAHRELLGSTKYVLAQSAFPSLWDSYFVVYGTNRSEIAKSFPGPEVDDDFLVLRLNPHLEAISIGLGVAVIPQLTLFPAIPVPSNSDWARADAKTKGSP